MGLVVILSTLVLTVVNAVSLKMRKYIREPIFLQCKVLFKSLFNYIFLQLPRRDSWLSGTCPILGFKSSKRCSPKGAVHSLEGVTLSNKGCP